MSGFSISLLIILLFALHIETSKLCNLKEIAFMCHEPGLECQKKKYSHNRSACKIPNKEINHVGSLHNECIKVNAIEKLPSALHVISPIIKQWGGGGVGPAWSSYPLITQQPLLVIHTIVHSHQYFSITGGLRVGRLIKS